MSRAIRRQQASAPKERQDPGRILGPRQPRPTRGARPPTPPRRRFRIGQPRWMEEIFSELKKVTWPSMGETRYLTAVVIVVAVAVGIVLGIVDIFFSWLIDQLLLS